MPISIQRGRQFASTEPTVSIFEADGKAGAYLTKASEKLVAQDLRITLRNGRSALKLVTADDWKKFLSTHCASKEATKDFPKKFGITFSDFVNAIDDAATSEEKGLVLDFRPTSALGKALSLDKNEGDYAAKLAQGAKVALKGVTSKTTGEAVAAATVSIGPEILATPMGSDWERDRTEGENWADFKSGNGASDIFKELTGPTPYIKLNEPKWNDSEAMALVEKFALPLRPEITRRNPDGTIKFQDGNEMFRDIYLDDRGGSLKKAGVSLRVRVRFDNNEPFTVNRVLIQVKEGRSVSGSDSQVRKFERRFEGTSVSVDEALARAISGMENGTPMVLSQKLYSLLKEKNTLPSDGLLTLEPKYTVLQKRRRTHLQLDSVSQVQGRKNTLQSEMDALKAANQPVPPEMGNYAKKLDSQISFLTNVSTLLQKYGQYAPSGECFIVSADRYGVYDTAARQGTPLVDTGDEVGRIGRGPLHLEAEWDSASSDPFQKAGTEIAKRLSQNPDAATKAVLEADAKALADMKAVFLKDVARTVSLVKEQLQAKGLEEDTSKQSKDERASEIANSNDRPTFWV